jgi:hypothetical protein
MLCQRLRIQVTENMDPSEDRMTTVTVAGMWQALGQAGVLFQRHRGEVRGHVSDRHPERMTVGEVDQVEGRTDTASPAATAVAASMLLQCQPMNGCIWSVPCVRRMFQTGQPYFA